MSESLRDALHAAAQHESSGYRVPESTVRTRARRRRATRIAATGTLSVALLAGSGIAVANLGLELGPAPAPIATTDFVTPEEVCGWQGASSALYTLVPLTSDEQRLEVAVGLPATFPVELTNNDGAPLDVPAGSAPVLVAKAGDDDPAVVGFAYLREAPAALTLKVGESATYVDFGPFIACPGAPTAPDGVHLAAGSYPLLAGQALDRARTAESSSFTTWGLLGQLELSDATVPEPSPEPTVPDVAAGSCGSTRWRVAAGIDKRIVANPQDLISLNSAAPEVDVSFSNLTSLDFEEPIDGGLALMVVEDGRVVALSRSLDPIPDGPLRAGAEFVFSDFEPLVHCETREPLPVGEYEVHAGRWVEDPERQKQRIIDFLSPGGTLVVTDRADFTPPRASARPTLPVCGEAATELDLGPDVIGSTISNFDVIEVEGPGDTGGGGAGPDNTVSTMDVIFDEAITSPTDVWGAGWNYVLLHDGVVVGTMSHGLDDDEWLDEDFDTAPDGDSPTRFDQTSATAVFQDCVNGNEYGPLVLDGSYTLHGYMRFMTIHELGVREEIYVEVGPYDFEHHPPTP